MGLINTAITEGKPAVDHLRQRLHRLFQLEPSDLVEAG
jgi:hypothetical protein